MSELARYLPTIDELLLCTEAQIDALLIKTISKYIADAQPDERAASRDLVQDPYPADPRTFCRRREAIEVLNESWSRLTAEGFIEQVPELPPGAVRLSGKGRRAATATSLQEIKVRQMLRREMLHEALQGDVYESFAAGRDNKSTLLAYKILEKAVATKAGLGRRLTGIGLLRTAFNPQGGPLADPNLPLMLREGVFNLFVGAASVLENSSSLRRQRRANPVVSMEELMLISRLMRFLLQ